MRIWLWLRVLVYAAGFVMISLVMAADLFSPREKVSSDFHTSFYVAGHLVETGQTRALYPGDNESFADAPFNKITHELLPDLSKKTVAHYMYGPLNAVLFAPLSLLSASYALLVFQMLSLLSLLLVSVLAARSAGREDFLVDSGVPDVFCFSLCFLPVFATVWIGQSGLIFGLLPFWIGLELLNRNRQFAAGAVWSLLLLKPHFAPVAGLIAVFYLFLGQWRCLCGGIAGGIVTGAAFTFCLGVPVMISWLHSLSSSETVLSTAGLVNPVHLVAGLPGAVMSCLPAGLKASAKIPVYGAGMGLLLIVFWLVLRVAQSSLPYDKKQALVQLLAILALVLFSPHLLVYDLCIYAAAGMLIFVSRQDALARYRRAAVAIWLFVNLDTIFIMALGPSMNPLVLPLGLVVLQIPVWLAVYEETRTAGVSESSETPQDSQS